MGCGRPIRAAARGLLFALLGAVTACATPGETSLALRQGGGLPAKAEVAAVPFIAQQDNYCGPASLAMAMNWSGLAVGQDDVAPLVFTPGRQGSLQDDMLVAARRFGRMASPLRQPGDLFTELAAGHPVVVFQNLGLEWFPRWHFAVAIGYDRAAEEILLHSGLDARTAMPLATFERTWARANYWAMVVLPPDRLPATADTAAALQAAAGLERAHRYKEAAGAYGAIARRWPDNLAAAIGVGNAHYGAGDIAGAAAGFRQAAERHPQAAAAWNNLGFVLGQLGRTREALAAVERAIALSGGDDAVYRDTLRQIGASGPAERVQ
jgi:tetratricopeptide (TPR) repeat protein